MARSWLPGGVQVRSGVSEVLAAFVGHAGGHRKEQMPLDASLKSAANVIPEFFEERRGTLGALLLKCTQPDYSAKGSCRAAARPARFIAGTELVPKTLRVGCRLQTKAPHYQ